jgi:hypothetical protein
MGSGFGWNLTGFEKLAHKQASKKEKKDVEET